MNSINRAKPTHAAGKLPWTDGDGVRVRLRERIVVFDSEMIPNSLIYPA